MQNEMRVTAQAATSSAKDGILAAKFLKRFIHGKYFLALFKCRHFVNAIMTAIT
jgi:hypothetical protein